MKVSLPRNVLLVLPLAFLAGCAYLGKAPEPPPAPVVEAPLSHPPIVSDRFLLDTPDQRLVGELQVIQARYEDTFVDIARTYNVGFDELVEANPDVDAWLPGEGTRILLPTRFILPDAPHEGVVVNLAAKRLFYFPEPYADGQRVVVTYPIGVGKEGTVTPVGTTTIISKAKDPVWTVPQSVLAEHAAKGDPLPPRVPPGPDNPLGAHALRLGMPAYLIHGTNKPAGVGMRSSHGCLRLFPENIAFMYEDVPVGTPVRIVNQPWLFAWADGALYFEAHAPFSDDTRDQNKLLADALAAALAELPNGSATATETSLASIRQRALGVPLPLSAGDAVIATPADSALFVNNLVNFPEPVPELLAQQVAE
jgi:L,D-transpeptidase ErfK/SrfK